MLDSNDIIELAHTSSGDPAFFPPLLHLLRDSFDCNVAAIHVTAAYPATGGGPLATVGFDPRIRHACARRWSTYLAELDPVGRAATKSDSVACDRDVFSSTERARKAYYKEFVAPQGGGNTLIGYLCLRNQALAALSLGRFTAPWPDSARRELSRLLPTLSIAVASAQYQVPDWPAGVRLTRREQDVLRRIEAGLTNSEIAACCGTSVNTVRNQVASLLEKLNVSTRTELAARGLGVFAEQHD